MECIEILTLSRGIRRTEVKNSIFLLPTFLKRFRLPRILKAVKTFSSIYFILLLTAKDRSMKIFSIILKGSSLFNSLKGSRLTCKYNYFYSMNIIIYID